MTCKLYWSLIGRRKSPLLHHWTCETRPNPAPTGSPRLLPGRRTVGCQLLQVCTLGWVKCREHISLLIILCIIVYVTNKAHPNIDPVDLNQHSQRRIGRNVCLNKRTFLYQPKKVVLLSVEEVQMFFSLIAACREWKTPFRRYVP